MSKPFKLDFSTPKNVISFDIGEKYTGVALVYNLCIDGGLAGSNIVLEQINHKSTSAHLDMERIALLISSGEWDLCILEEYKLYPTRVDKEGKPIRPTHFKTWSYLLEVRHLGATTYLAQQAGIPVVLQDASVVKNRKKPKVPMSGYTTGSHVKDAINHVNKYFLSNKHRGRTVKF